MKETVLTYPKPWCFYKKTKPKPEGQTTSADVSDRQLTNGPSQSPLLPLEIMLKIWLYVLPEPCFVTTERDHDAKLFRNDINRLLDDQLRRYFRTDQPVPVVLQICRASRYEFLYDPTITRNHPTYQLFFMGHRRWIYMDADRDMLVLDTTWPAMHEYLPRLRFIGAQVHVKCSKLERTTAGFNTEYQMINTFIREDKVKPLRNILLSKRLEHFTLIFPDARDMFTKDDAATPIFIEHMEYFNQELQDLFNGLSVEMNGFMEEVKTEIKDGSIPTIITRRWSDILLTGPGS